MKTITLLFKKSFFICLLILSPLGFAQEIGVGHTSNNNSSSISDNSSNSPNLSNNTNFGANSTMTLYIKNLKTGQPSTLTISSISLSNPDFTITSGLANNILDNKQVEPFTISYIGSSCGTFTSTVTVTHDGTNDTNAPTNQWIFTVSTTVNPEINITGNAITIVDGDTTPDAGDNTIFPTTDVGFSSAAFDYTIENTGGCDLDISSITLSNATDFTLTDTTPETVASGSTTTFSIIFNPTANGTTTSIVTINNNDSNENPYTFTIKGQGIAPLTEGPGGVVSNLQLWLKGNDGLSYTDGDSVSLWATQGRGSDATVNTPGIGQEPTYKDNVNDNINFNPVVDFDGDYVNIPLDGDFSYDMPNRNFLEGTNGYYSQDVFTVLIPDVTVNKSFGSMDIFCGDEDIATNNTDATGIGLGKYTVRFTDEVLVYAHGPTASGNGYGVAEIDSGSGNNIIYNNAGIINARNSLTGTQQELYYNAINKETNQNDVADFANVNDARYWIGRSEGWEASTDARIAEIITYSSRKNDTDLTQERNRIQSYLAIKYGITLGVNGTSQDYVDSDGTVIWDVNTGVPSDDVFNYDITGIGRDDVSGLYQKQSRSVNNASDGTGRTQGVLTMGITSIANTNNLNTNTLQNKQFLTWGNNGVSLNNPAVVVDVDMSTSITPAIPGGTWVQFNAIPRTWKVVETRNGNDIPSVEVAVLKSAIRTAAPPNGRYLMFISDTPNFDPTADYRVMTESTNELGEAIVKTNYDFDNTKYITFGWAPERVYTRSIYFDGVDDYVDMEDALNLNTTAAGFTVSAWVKRGTSSANKSIISKRDAAYTQGYDFKIEASGKFEMSWKNGSTQTITSNVVIPTNEWHHLAVIYDSGSAKMYIDGVLDKTVALTAPVNSAQSFYLGAAGKLTPTAFFEGNIDEVRVWDTALSVDQLRYVMNQEIQNNASFVGAKYFANRSVLPTKNDVSSLQWSKLAGYYPMTTYTYTNTKDESGNGHQGALRQLRTVDRQTAPLPYVSTQSGDWDTSSTWVNGSVQTKPGAPSIVDNTKTIDWNIVETNHDITIDNSSLPAAANGNRTLLGLFNDSNKITINGDNTTKVGYGLTVTHFLNLEGKIDLEGESQLIQTLNSDLEITSSGTVEKDQQGTRDLFTYNYWSSPVGVSNIISNNNSITTPNVLLDGTNSAIPASINFLTSGYNGAIGSPLKIADYWIWKYANQPSNQYSAWQHVRSTGTILAGEGFTMKGVANTSGNITLQQNYVFTGKPNNGDISLTLAANNDYLVGNPYPSALDADEFIKDNISNLETNGRNTSGNVINGALYFWDHFASGTHVLKEYEGGYATYTLMGGTAAINNDTRINATGGVGTKIPERYIPVGQGFFVSSVLDTNLIGDSNDPGITQPVVGGSILFKNSQRIFKKEVVTGSNSGSVFLRSNTGSSKEKSTDKRTTESKDTRPKIRLMYDSPKGYHRQLLVGVDENTTNNFDLGYDAPLIESNLEDLFWNFNNAKFTIQAVNNFDKTQTLPIGIKTSILGKSIIRIETLENIDETTQIFIHDKESNMYHNLKDSNFEIQLPIGEYLNRFEITFSAPDTPGESLGVSESELNGLTVYYSNESESIVLVNPNQTEINKIELLNILGQSILKINKIGQQETTEYKVKNLSSGTYVLKMHTVSGSVSKKVLVK